MALYSALRNLAYLFGFLGNEAVNLGNAIRNVWLIGQYFAGWLYAIGGLFRSLEDVAGDAAHGWSEFYNWVLHSLNIDDRLRDLMRYADDLVSFIRYPFVWIADSIRDFFPDLFEVARDPIAWLLETLTRYTGISWEFLDSPLQWLRSRLRDLIGDVLEIARDPRGWLIDWLGEIIPDWFEFLYDARMWVRKRIEDEFPDLVRFLRDPDRFLIEKFLEFIDDFAGRYQNRVIKLVEQIINNIF